MGDLGSADARPLSETERALLVAILARLDTPAASELRAQIGKVVVTGGKPTSLSLSAVEAAPAPGVPDGPLPIDAQVEDDTGTYLGVLHVWVEAGRLSAIDFGWVTDMTPTELPDPTWLRFY